MLARLYIVVIWCVCGVALLAGAAPLRGQTPRPQGGVPPERAGTAQRQGDLETAVSELRKVIELNPSDARAHGRLGMVYRRLGRLPEAIESLENALRLEPALPRLKILLGFSFQEAGRYQDAIPLLAESFELERESAVKSVVGQRLVECYLAAADEQRALEVVQKLRQGSPDDPDVLHLALRVYMSLWNSGFQRLLTKAPGSRQARLIVAESLEAQERFTEAANEYAQVLSMEPELPGIHFQLGRMILRSDTSAGGGDEKALAEFRKELELNPMHVGALVEIGEIQLKRGRFSEAAQSFSQALKVQPVSVPARLGLAKVRIAEKQWAEALDQLENARKLAPEDEAVAYHLMVAYRALGRTAEARSALDAFQQLKKRKQQSRSGLPAGVPQR